MFYALKQIGVDFDLAKEIRDQAIEAHLPNRQTIKTNYRKWKNKYDSLEDFEKSWARMISDAAINVFYIWFNAETEEHKQTLKEELFSVNEKGETVAPNGMSKEEYNRMRRYAESFPLVDVAALRRQRAERLKDFEDEDLEL